MSIVHLIKDENLRDDIYCNNINNILANALYVPTAISQLTNPATSVNTAPFPVFSNMNLNYKTFSIMFASLSQQAFVVTVYKFVLGGSPVQLWQFNFTNNSLLDKQWDFDVSALAQMVVGNPYLVTISGVSPPVGSDGYLRGVWFH